MKDSLNLSLKNAAIGKQLWKQFYQYVCLYILSSGRMIYSPSMNTGHFDI